MTSPVDLARGPLFTIRDQWHDDVTGWHSEGTPVYHQEPVTWWRHRLTYQGDPCLPSGTSDMMTSPFDLARGPLFTIRDQWHDDVTGWPSEWVYHQGPVTWWRVNLPSGTSDMMTSPVDLARGPLFTIRDQWHDDVTGWPSEGTPVYHQGPVTWWRHRLT